MRSTILQHLTIRSNVSFNDPATPDGKLWNSALKGITQSQGWSQLHWGAHIASEDNVDLLVIWNSQDDLQRFMTHEYQSFITAIKPILPLRDGKSSSVPSPYILQLHLGMPALKTGAVSSLYELSFESQPDVDRRTGLTIETQLCRNLLTADSEKLRGDGDLFLGMDASWMEQCGSTGSSSSSSTATGPKLQEGKPDEQNPEIFLIMTEWVSTDAEKKLLESGKIKQPHGGPTLTLGEYFSQNLLEQASTYAKHHVVFENVSPFNVQWLDKEEKWSTFLKRFVEESEHVGSEDDV